MKKIRWIISCLCLAVTVSAQESIERLFPLLGKCEGVHLYESINQQETDSVPDKDYSVMLLPVDVNSLPQGIKDSIIAAFDYELSKASESDRYQKHCAGADTLSYSMIYYRECQTNNDTHIPGGVFEHHYTTDIYITAKLDVINGQLFLSYVREGSPKYWVWPRDIIYEASPSTQRHDAAELTILFNEIAVNSAVNKQPLSFDGSKNTCGYCLFQTIEFKKCRSRGIRLEVPPSIAEDVYAKMADAINKVIFTGCSYAFSQEKNDIGINFGKDWQGEAFLMHRAADGRVYIFHKEPQEEGYDNDIPRNWYSEDYLK